MPLRQAKLTDKQNFTHDVTELTFETADQLTFESGQFVTFKVTDKMPPCFRAYSISSCPKAENNRFSTCIKVVPEGRGSNWLNNLNIDDTVEFMGPNGKFLFKNNGKNSVFVATGTGITPFKSMIETELLKGNKNKLQLLFGVRYVKDIFYEEFFKDLAAKYPNFTYEFTVSRPENDEWHGSTGRVSNILETMPLELANTEVYICGLKEMINDVTEILKTRGMPPDSINSEKYD
ncbi:MAG: FAD-dependent oxidoreductase [Patescibacteria group bacterium]